MPYVFFGVAFAFLAAAVFILLFVGRMKPPPFVSGAALDDDAMAAHMRSLGAEYKAVSKGAPGVSAAPVVKRLKRFYKLKKIFCRRGMFDGERWLYENRNYLLGGLASASALTGLPCVSGYPRVYLLCAEIVKHMPGAIDGERFKKYLTAFQAVSPLHYTELRALPDAMMLAAAEQAAIYAGRFVKIRKNLEAAAAGKPADPRNNSYVYGVMKYGTPKQKARLSGINTGDAVVFFERRVSAYSAAVAALITAMRESELFMTAEFLRGLSALDRILRAERAGVYKNMRDFSREAYMLDIAEISDCKNIPEEYVGRHLTALADANNTHIGRYLYEKPVFFRARTFLRYAYLWLPFLVSVAAAALLSVFYTPYAAPLFFLFYPFARRLTLAALKPFAPPRPCPRLKFDSIPDEYATAAVMSELLCSPADAASALGRLHKLKYANQNSGARFMLLADLKPSEHETEPGDAELIRALDEYPCDGDIEIYVRPRSYHKRAGACKWFGRERKRGAVLDYFAFVAEGRDMFAYKRGAGFKPKFALLLDADTFTPDVKAFAEACAHPLNTQTVLTPEIRQHMPKTAFQKMFGGGYSPYPGALQDEYPVARESAFCGKAIVKIEPFYQRLNGLFRPESVLSHDIPEGAAVTSAATGIPCYEGYPRGGRQFFKRAARWTRGDWQLLLYMFPYPKNPLSAYGRFLIFSNILYSLEGVAALFLLFLTPFYPPLAAAAAAYFLLPALLYGVFPEAFRALYRLMSLPYAALSSICAAVVTLARLATRRKLLEWETFAAGGGKKQSYYLTCAAVNAAAGAALMVLCHRFAAPAFARYACIAAAVLFAAFPVVDLVLAYEPKKKKDVSDGARAMIEDAARRTWQFFKDMLDINCLTYDNYQEDFSRGYAKMASPTNMGFAVTAVINARDLDFIGAEEAFAHLGKIADAINGLEKFNGVPYNWYNPDSGRKLSDYISFVDAGNLFCALLAAIEALKTHDAPASLIGAFDSLVSGMDLTPLYDRKRKLFMVGADAGFFAERAVVPADGDACPAADKCGRYDLFASEASLSSYAAIAAGLTDKEHWAHLSRKHVRACGASLVSWTGGMFEYLMPFLFLDIPEGSMLHKSAANAVKSQRKFAARAGAGFFGVSESQYADTGDSSAYLYRAFGDARVAVKDFEDAAVFSPYSSFLALCVAPHAAMRSISALIDAGMYGEYGFYEACDMRAGSARPVKTYMTHHQGMILCAAVNFLKDGLHAKRLSNYRRGACNYLLTEAPPRRAKKKCAAVCSRPAVKSFRRVIDLYANVCQEAGLALWPLIRGRSGLLIDERGNGCWAYNGLKLERFYNTSRDNGVRFGIVENGTYTDVYAAAERAVQTEICAVHTSLVNGLLITITTCAAVNFDGEAREIVIRNRSDTAKKFRFTAYYEPVFAPECDYRSHPAFNRMFVRTEKGAGGCVFAESVNRAAVRTGAFLTGSKIC
ncbi:MAG: hypothetical protein FWE62_03380, partial [Firmicutes bacterium]|nr:hypothetical protein [Bacillota bacterium]